MRVGLGVAGADLTQVTSGLHVGDEVLLADLGQPVPTGSTTGAQFGRFFGGAGRFTTTGR